MKRGNIYALLMFASLLLVYLIADDHIGRITAQTTSTPQPARFNTNIAIQRNAQGKPWINVSAGRELLTTTDEHDSATITAAQPLALAAADFNEDGIADLVSSYAEPNSLALHLGNADAIYPNSPAARQHKAAGQFTEVPFLSSAHSWAVPVAPHWIGTGDFNADGHQDVVLAARGSAQLFWLAGNGKGEFAAPASKPLPGVATSLLTGEINRADGRADVIVGIIGESEPQLLIFESANGAFNAEPERITLPVAATALALGQLDEAAPFDLAVAAGNELLIVQGRDRKTTLSENLRADVKPAAMERVPFNYTIASVATGRFTEERNDSIALLATNGVVHLLTRASDWRNEAGTVAAVNNAALPSSTSARLVRAAISTRPFDDLLVVDASNRQLHIVMGEMLWQQTARAKEAESVAIPRQPIALQVEGTPAAVLPMRLNPDALSDLVVLKSGGQSALAIAQTEATTFTVNDESELFDIKPGDGICANSAGKCSLQAALNEIEGGQGGVTIVFTVPKAHLLHYNSPGPYSSPGNIEKPVTIDGSSIGHVEIYSRGESSPVWSFGSLAIRGGKSVIRGLALNTLILNRNTGNIVEDTFVGLYADGRLDSSATMSIGGSDENTLGGLNASARNVLAHRVLLMDCNTNSIIGNHIGFTPAGDKTLVGTYIEVSSPSAQTQNNTIGGLEAGASNKIYGGVSLKSLVGTVGNKILGNYLYWIWSQNGVSDGLIQKNDVQFNTADGIVIEQGSVRNVIRENTVANNLAKGMRIEAPDTQILGNSIYGNELGIQVNATAAKTIIQANWIGLYYNLAAPNNGPGIEINSSDNTIGGDRNTEGNLISGNKGPGILLAAGAKNNQLKGNWIGVQSDGTSPLGNTGDGIVNNGENNPIGATSPNLRNLIAFNSGNGVTINAGNKGNTLLGNEIYSNLGKGISITSGQIVPVPDLVLNFRNSRTVIDGKLSGAASTTYRVEFFTNEECDSSGSGEGKAFLGVQNVTTDAAGRVQFSPELYPAQNQIVTATVTDPANNTSEFSKCSELDEVKIVTIVPAITEVLAPGATQDFTVTAGYTLKSRFQAEVAFKLEDANKNTVAYTSEVIKSTDGASQKELKLTGVKIPSGLDRLIVKVFLLDIGSPGSGPIFKEAPQIEYKITSQDSIEVQNATFDGVPAATAKIYSGSKVEYKCDLRYHIPSDPKGGVVALQAFDMTSGAAKAISNIVLVPVDRTTEPKLLTGEKITIDIPTEVQRIQVRAVLLDSSGVTIVTKHFVDYVPIQIKIELGEYNTSSKTFMPFNPPLVLRGGGDASKQRQSSVAIKVTPSLDAEFNQAFPHFVAYKQKDGEIIGQFTASAFTPEEPLPNPVYRVDWADFFSFVPDDSDQLLLQLKYNFVATNKVVASNLVPLEIDRVKIITKSGIPNFPSSATILKQGRTEKFGFWLEYNMKRPGVNELQAEVVCTTPTGPNLQIIKPALKPSGERFEFDVTIPSDAQDMQLYFRLANQSDPTFVYSTQSVHCKNMDKIAITIPSGVGQVISNTLGVSLNTVQNTVDRAVDAIRTIGNLGALAGSKPKSFALEEVSELAEQNATIAAVFGNYLLVNSYWSFTPAIPADGTFVADLTLQYNTTDLPDDPAFNAASLKVIAFDPATGVVEAYPSNVNLSARTVTARINRLAPYYTLGMENPLTARALDFPVLRQFSNFDSRLLLLNTGSATAALTMRAYAVDGALYSGQGMTNPASVSMPASQLTSATSESLFKMTGSANGGWVQAAANQRTVLGYEMIGKDNRLDGLSVPLVHPGSFVISQVECSATWETEIHLANVSAFIGTLALELRDANGTIVGTWEQVMQAHSAYSAPLSELFPNVPATFNGYVLGQSDQPVSVAALLTSNTEIAALNAQPWQAENSPATLYLPFASYEPGFFASKLNVVNPTTSTATLKLRLRDEQGKEVAASANLTLQPGQQYQRGIHQIFSVNDGFAGAVTIESSITGVIGDVEYTDPSGQTKFRTVLPLIQTPTTAYVFPHIDTRVDTLTQLAVFNPNAQPVQVEVKVFKPDGTSSGSTKVTLLGNAFFTEWLDELVPTAFNLNGGYFTVTAEVPICAGAIFGTLEGTMMASLPGQLLAATTIGSVASVSAASYATGTEVALDSIISAFGANLATNVQGASSLPLPTALLGSSVSIRDSVGVQRLAPLFFVSPLQINYLIPAGTSTGNATITVTNPNGIVTRGVVTLVNVAPGLFTADQNGSGVAAANAIYVKNGVATSVALSRYDPALQKNVAVPVDLTRPDEEVLLELYGTGIRHRTSLSDVQCLIGGVPVEVQYAGAQGGYVGLDQVNVRLPKSLAGRGEVDIVLTVAGRKANTARVNFR